MTVAATLGVDGVRMDEFSRAGYVVLPGLLAGARLRRAQDAARSAVKAPSGISCERPNNTLTALRWDDVLIGLITDARDRIGDAIGARDLRWISGYVSTKDPHSPPLWWHQDWWAWDHPITFQPDAAQVAVLCYLTDTTIETGALRLMPGTHRASVELHRVLPEAHADESSALDLSHPAMADQPGQASLELRAGDAVVTDYRLLHGTHANTGSHYRDCALLSFAPHWNELPDDVRGHLVRHPALPRPDECGAAGCPDALLPTFDGPRRDLALNRNAPAVFAIPIAGADRPART